MPRHIEIPSDDPIPTNGKEVVINKSGDAKPNPSFVGQAVDASGAIIKGPAADGAKLIDQFGVGTALMAFVLAVFLVLLFVGIGFALLIRADVLASTAHANESHKQEVAALIDRDKERAADMFDRHKSLVQAFKESRQDIKDTTDATRDLIREVKIGNAITKEGQEIMKTNSSLLEKIVQGKK